MILLTRDREKETTTSQRSDQPVFQSSILKMMWMFNAQFQLLRHGFQLSCHSALPAGEDGELRENKVRSMATQLLAKFEENSSAVQKHNKVRTYKQNENGFISTIFIQSCWICLFFFYGNEGFPLLTRK